MNLDNMKVETYEGMGKVDHALCLIQEQYERFGQDLFVAHSGGKDSAVVLHLAMRVFGEGSGFIVVHNPKPETHPLTVQYLYELSQTLTIGMIPSHRMLAFAGDPESKCQIDGTRRAEHTRTERSSDLIIDGANVSRENMPAFVEQGIFGLSILYPIYNWTDEEVWDYIKDNCLEVSREYSTNYVADVSGDRDDG